MQDPDGEIRVSEADRTLSIEVPGKKVELSFSVSICDFFILRENKIKRWEETPIIKKILLV